MIELDYFWAIIFILAFGTIAIRFSIIGVAHRVQISEQVRHLFSFIPAAILPALIAPAVSFHQGQVEGLFGKERAVILALSTVVCYFTRSTFLTIVFGLVTLYVVCI